MSTSGKSSDFKYQSRQLCGYGPCRWYKGVGEIHMDNERVGEESKGKETGGCPPTTATTVHHCWSFTSGSRIQQSSSQ
jgi:hypothetical protein